MDPAKVPEGIDPKSACRVEINVNGYFTVRGGRKEYNRGRTVSWVVDSEKYTIIDLEKDIAPYFTWGSDQQANFWVVTRNTMTSKLSSDVQLLDLLRASEIVKLFMVVGTHEQNITEEEMPAAVHIGDDVIPTAMNIGEEVNPVAVDSDLDVLDGGFTWAEAPQYGETTGGPQMPEEEEKEHFMIVGCDPTGDDPAGADEEWRYFKTIPDDEVQKRKRARTISEIREFDTETVLDDEATIRNDFFVPHTSHDKENPIIKVGDTFIDKDAFVYNIKQYAIKNQFETRLEHSDKERYRARCADNNCNWRVYVKKLHGSNTFMVVKLSGFDEHTCPNTSSGREASTVWISEKLKDIVKEDPTLPAKKLQRRLEKHYDIELSYFKVWSGKKSAMDDLHGTWEDTFDMLWRFKAALEECCPGSIVEIDCKKINGEMYFSRMFVAIRACIDGFLAGCRPYLGVDSTHLTGKYKGQLAAATTIDGHNWMYSVAYGIFGKETNSNWTWFMAQLKRAVGTPPGLTIHTDACKGLAYAVNKVFKGDAEHRECFRHLMANFRKKFKGDVLKFMWPCAWACTDRRYDTLMEKIATASPKAIPFLNTHHKLKWSRSKFSKECKVDYVNNNISECFNNWIKDDKDLPVADLMDKIREKIMGKIYTRQVIASRLEGYILPSVLHELNMKSRGLHYEIQKSGAMSGEISGITKEGKSWRVAVDIQQRTCGCGQWQISGKPCTHAIALFGKVRQLNIENFVDDYYSLERFKAAYHFVVTPMGDKTQWPKFDPGFKMIPPKLERPAGRPRKKRIKASGGAGKRGPYQCKRCFQFGHIEKGCNATQAELEQELPPHRPKNSKGKRKSKSEIESSANDPQVTPRPSATTASPGPITRSMSSLSPTSPGPTTRSMSSLSPTSSCPRRMASISPGGINRRIIIS